MCRNPNADAFTQDRGWFDEYERFWSDVLTAHRHHQNTKLRIHALYPPSTVPHTDKEHWSFCGGSRWDCTLLTHFMVGFLTSPLCRWVFIWRFKWKVVSVDPGIKHQQMYGLKHEKAVSKFAHACGFCINKRLLACFRNTYYNQTRITVFSLDVLRWKDSREAENVMSYCPWTCILADLRALIRRRAVTEEEHYLDSRFK